MRNSTYDILRVAACIMVVFMHAPMPSANADAGTGLFLSALSYFTAPCIGLFFMVSGALLLPVRMNTSSFLKRRFSKVLIPTLVWSVFYISTQSLLRGG